MKLFTAIIATCYTSICLCQINTTPAKPFVLGIIDEIQSNELSEKRILNIYLPEGYNTKDTISYPVVYLLDGSADEDFIHVTGLYQFDSFEWIKRVPKSIIVGIASVDRRRDFTFPTNIAEERKNYPTTGHSKQFINFLEKELQPYIQKKYKVNAARTIIGQSLGGLIATEILLKKPTLFSQYIIISPSLWWDNGSLLDFEDAKLQKTGSTPTKIYIGVGKEGRVMETDANLLVEKINKAKNANLKVYFDYLPMENHATIMHQALSNALQLLNAAGSTEK